jgi:hypothetical protein
MVDDLTNASPVTKIPYINVPTATISRNLNLHFVGNVTNNRLQKENHLHRENYSFSNVKVMNVKI